MTDDTSEVLTINTIKGLYRVKTLPFRVAAAPGIFHKVTDTTLADSQKVSMHFNDIISRATAEEHAHRLNQVLTKLEDAKLRLKEAKWHLS